MILIGKKKCLLQKDVPNRSVPKWPQLALKNIYSDVIKAYPELLEYFPDPEPNSTRFPPREFFFAIFAALKPLDFDQMLKDAAKM